MGMDLAPNGVDKVFQSCVLDDVDKCLLQLLQEDFPLVEYPWRELGVRLGVSEQQVFSRVENLCAAGVIRRIGPIVDLSKTGYSFTTLVALRVPEDKVDAVALIINDYSRAGNVSHNYEREHEYNVWFTLAAGSEHELSCMLSEVLQRAGLSQSDVLNLPTVKRFKINVNFLVNTTNNV
jgi:DNA-binding Lrp family transcriptional regulator